MADGLRDRIVAGLHDRDPDAIAAAVEMLPARVPPAIRRAHRDRAIARLAIDLRGQHPGIDDFPLAGILAAAAAKVARKCPLPAAKPFDTMSRQERQELSKRVRGILEWSGPWPKQQRVWQIIEPVVTGR